jgi:GxxExxY protein
MPAPHVYERQQPSERFDDLSREVLTAALEVQHHLGTGLLRSAYETCLAQELRLRGIRANLIYRDEPLPIRKLIPMVVENSLMVACHCVKELSDLQLARDRSLLKATQAESGLCLNFHSESLATEIRRIRAHAA